jgi:hypothetical protein
MAKKKKIKEIPTVLETEQNFVQYTGDNDKELMEFCGAYHIECYDKEIRLHFLDEAFPIDSPKHNCIIIKIGQYLVNKNNNYFIKDKIDA